MIKTLNSLDRQQVVTPVFQEVLSADTTTIVIPVLSGTAWRMEFAVKALNTGDMSLLFNTDSVETDYYSTNLAGTQTNNRSYLGYASAANDIIHGSVDIKLAQYRVSYVSRTIRMSGTTISNIGIAATKAVDITSLSQLSITSPVSTMFLSGSWFRLYEIC